MSIQFDKNTEEIHPPQLRFWNPETRQTFTGTAIRCADCFMKKDPNILNFENKGWVLVGSLTTVGDRIIYPHAPECPSKDDPA